MAVNTTKVGPSDQKMAPVWRKHRRCRSHCDLLLRVDNVSALYPLRVVKTCNKWRVYPHRYFPGFNQILCWFQPNVCNETLSYFWRRVCWRLRHDDIVLLCNLLASWFQGGGRSRCFFLCAAFKQTSGQDSTKFITAFSLSIYFVALAPALSRCQDSHTRSERES